jgi:acyl dehydratase
MRDPTSIRVVQGATARFEKTVSEADVALYLGLCGDELPSYLVAQDDLPRRVPPAMELGYVSAAVTLLVGNLPGVAVRPTRYRVEFPGPVYAGDTLVTSVTVVDRSDADDEFVVDLTSVNQDGRVVARGRAHHQVVSADR